MLCENSCKTQAIMLNSAHKNFYKISHERKTRLWRKENCPCMQISQDRTALEKQQNISKCIKMNCPRLYVSWIWFCWV